MRDISAKQSTLRTAKAEAVLSVGKETIKLLKANELPKGDPLPIAKVAAVQAAKQTSLLIPYCHPLPIDFVDCRFEISANSITVETVVKSVYKTGVEMEALAAAASAALTLYDMMKAVDDSMEIRHVRLLEKRGGKSDFTARTTRKERTAAVLVLSDSRSQGRNTDVSGKILEQRLQEIGFDVVELKILADEARGIEEHLKRYADTLSLDLVITTGGTGLGPRDVTPEATGKVITREAYGIAEALRSAGLPKTPYSMLSRGRSGVRGKTLIINLPGSEAGVRESMDLLVPILHHALDTIAGADHSAENKKRT